VLDFIGQLRTVGHAEHALFEDGYLVGVVDAGFNRLLGRIDN